MLKGFKNFLMRGDVIVVAVGLVVALAFSGLITAFTTFIINPLIAAVGPKGGAGLGVWLTKAHDSKKTTFLDFGSFISAIIYFVVFVAVVYFLIVMPYKTIMRRQGKTVFGEPAPTATCPACLSDDLNPAATKCKYCGSDLAATAPPL
ncbi:MAG: MscL family protein [Jatrophihabitantaceae bacterium]